MRNWKEYFGDKEMVLAFFYQLAIGMLGAFVMWLVLCCGHFKTDPKIGTVNITGIVNDFVKSQASAHLSEQETKIKVEAFGKNLEKTLHQLAEDKHLVLFPSEAVIAGANDYTSYVVQEMNSDA
jgi:hypothetical protein